MKEFYAFIVAKHKAGLDKPRAALGDADALNDVQSMSSSTSKQPSSQDLEKMSANGQLLHQANEDYLNKFKLVCREMEQKFFGGKTEGPFIFGTKPTCFDHILYQELLTAMVLSGYGRASDMFSTDTAFRLYEIQKLSKWYSRMGQEEVSKRLAARLTDDLRGGNKEETVKIGRD